MKMQGKRSPLKSRKCNEKTVSFILATTVNNKYVGKNLRKNMKSIYQASSKSLLRGFLKIVQ